MSLSLAELDAQDVTLLPERATLHHGGGVTIVHQTAIAAIFDGSYGSADTNVAVAAIVTSKRLRDGDGNQLLSFPSRTASQSEDGNPSGLESTAGFNRVSVSERCTCLRCGADRELSGLGPH